MNDPNLLLFFFATKQMLNTVNNLQYPPTDSCGY